jgi:putative transposase
MQNSWFSTPLKTASSPKLTNYVTTYSPSLLSSSLATTEGGPPQVESDGEPKQKKARIRKRENLKPSVGKSKRIRVYPNAAQKVLLNCWFGTARWTYNQCLQKIKEDRTNLKKGTLRALVVHNACHEEKETKWVLGTPYMIRDGAMSDLVNAYTSNFAKKKKDASHRFTLKFRSKKNAQESIYVEGRNFKKGVFYPSFFGKTPLKSAEPLPDKVDYDCRLTRNHLGHYHICIPQPLDLKSDNQAQRVPGRVAALDPGVRTFHTIYDSTGCIFEVGKNDIGRIYRLCYYLDNLESRITSASSKKQKYRMRNAALRMRLRIRNLVDECHKKLVTFLLSEYEVILLPSFETKDMVSRRKRVLSSKSARAMLTWSHYRFKQRLLFKRQEYPWCKILVVDEAFTTKTCGHCGKLHPTLTSSKVFHCPSCGVVLDRDANAARNILLKNSSLFGFTAEEALGLTPSSTL